MQRIGTDKKNKRREEKRIQKFNHGSFATQIVGNIPEAINLYLRRQVALNSKVL